MAAPTETPPELDDLREKYARILALREAHARARCGDAEEPDPRGAMSALASRWPGALRELDDLPHDVIVERIDALAAARDGAQPVATWMRAQLVFHASARGALIAKRWLRGRREVSAGVRAAYEARAAGNDEARAWIDDLARVARPPCGRVLALVWERVARKLAVSEDEARGLVFGGGLRSARHLLPEPPEEPEPDGVLAAGAAAGAAAAVAGADEVAAPSDDVVPPPSLFLLLDEDE